MRSRTTGRRTRFWCLCCHQIASWWGGSFCYLPRSWTSLARALLCCRLYWGVLLFYLWIQFVDWRIFQKSVVAGWQWKLLGYKWLNQLACACVYYWLSICIKFNFLYHFTRGTQKLVQVVRSLVKNRVIIQFFLYSMLFRDKLFIGTPLSFFGRCYICRQVIISH